VATDFPWYDLVQSGSELAQGDLLFECPVVSPAPEIAFPIPEGTIPAVKDIFDVVVMNQSYDLVNEKIADVLLCPHWDLNKAAEADPELKKSREVIRKGQHYRYLLLAESEIQERSMNVRMVDFGRILACRKNLLSTWREAKRPDFDYYLRTESICPRVLPAFSCASDSQKISRLSPSKTSREQS
jgi:hypothetical protein